MRLKSGPPIIFDRRTYRARRRRAAGEAFLAVSVAEQLGERLAAVNRRFSAALDLGSRAESFAVLRSAAQAWVHAAPVASASNVVVDDDLLPFADGSFDLVTSVLGLHAVNDLPGALIQIRRALRPDGLFLGAMFAGETLTELRQAFTAAESNLSGGASPRVAPFGDVRDLGGLLQRAGFTLPVADMERTIVRYRDLDTLFADLRALGETNILAERSKRFLARGVFRAMRSEYEQRFRDPDGRFRATFDVGYLTGWSAHESQQKPLRPGSAKTSLAAALGTKEIPTGEKPS